MWTEAKVEATSSQAKTCFKPSSPQVEVVKNSRREECERNRFTPPEVQLTAPQSVKESLTFAGSLLRPTDSSQKIGCHPKLKLKIERNYLGYLGTLLDTFVEGLLSTQEMRILVLICAACLTSGFKWMENVMSE